MMRDRISDETIEYVAILAKLELSREEKEKILREMEKMLDYFSKLKEVDTSMIEPMSHLFDLSNVFREDQIEKQKKGEEILKNAPQVKDRMIHVPGTIEE